MSGASAVIEVGPEGDEHDAAGHLKRDIGADSRFRHAENAARVDDVEGKGNSDGPAEEAAGEQEAELAMPSHGGGGAAEEWKEGLGHLRHFAGRLVDQAEDDPRGDEGDQRAGEEEGVVLWESKGVRGEHGPHEGARPDGPERAPETPMAEESSELARGDGLGDDVEECRPAQAAGEGVARVGQEEGYEGGGGPRRGEEVEKWDGGEKADGSEGCGEDVERTFVRPGLEVVGGEELRQKPAAHADGGDAPDDDL